MSHLGKLFKHKGHKAPTPPRKDYDGTKSGSDESENDEGYLDPVAVHPTTDPTTAVQMPSYPPPRPNHSPSSRRVQDPGKRASVPITLAQLSRPPVPKARTQRPQSAELLQAGKTPIPAQRLGLKVRLHVRHVVLLWYLPVCRAKYINYSLTISMQKVEGSFLLEKHYITLITSGMYLLQQAAAWHWLPPSLQRC